MSQVCAEFYWTFINSFYCNFIIKFSQIFENWSIRRLIFFEKLPKFREKKFNNFEISIIVASKWHLWDSFQKMDPNRRSNIVQFGKEWPESKEVQFRCQKNLINERIIWVPFFGGK